MGENLQHTSAEPMKLTYKLLEKLTDCFAEERKLGSGAFGVVYKGVHENGEEIAVKVFRNMAVDDSEFQKEFQNLRRLKHQNIVELKGYCNESEETLMEYQGQQRLVETLHMALCLEYVENGSLEKHLSDECQGLNWRLRYKIIKGICEGLKYLSDGLDEPIWHLDLKPGNILLDKNMVPKIADFGLSRLFGEEKTKKTINSVGTCGYWPPEYVKHQVLSNGYDIFSLGVIIVKIMTGHEGYSIVADMTRRKFVQHVHNNWRKKLQEILWHSSLEVYCQQVKTCIDIALKCMLPDRHHRPSIQEIVLNLNETETMAITQFHDEEFIFLSNSNSTSKPSSERGSEASRSSYTERRLNSRPNLPFHILKGDSRYGGFGSVYKGVYENGEAVAVKILYDVPPDFEEEMRHLTKVQHLNIVQILGFSTHDTSKYRAERFRTAPTRYHGLLCFEYFQNGSLHRYISDGCSRLEWHTCFGIIKGTCEGLGYLHEGLPSPILHLNLQPTNILLDEKMVPKIGGFGLSGFLDGDHGPSLSGRIVRYMSPEFIEKRVISDKTDVYSLGVIILEIIAGYKYRKYLDGDNELLRIINFVGTWTLEEEATGNIEGHMIICTQNSRQALSVDVHPTDPWIMTSHHGGSVCIWNYETMATVNSFEISGEPVNSAKFIVREQWFVAGDGNGYIYVYSYDTEEEEIIFEAHGERVTSLAVHPTQPYVLSSSDDHLIKLWDWEKGWECTRTFQGHTNRVVQVTFNPNDTNRFISASMDCKAKIWTLDSPDPDNTMDGHSADLSCVDYGTGGDRRYLLTGSEDGTAQIWDMETQKCIRKLEGHADHLSAVYWHPELPILTTGSLDGTVRIWNSTTYRLENVISFNLGAVYAFVYIKGLRRIVVGCHQGIAMMEINLQ